MTHGYNSIIKRLAQSIHPFDEQEAQHQRNVLNWIDSGAPLCRTIKPAIPPKHLVSYFTLFDPKEDKILLVDHKKALLWLPPGGHVEPGEHPHESAHRELSEELGVRLPLLISEPLFLTITKTVGLTAGHIDVSFWYVFLADSKVTYSYNQDEFSAVKWFSFDELPLQKADPHLARFCSKLKQLLHLIQHSSLESEYNDSSL